MYEVERIRPGKQLKKLLYEKQKGRCNYCGIKLDIRYFDVDHKTPVSYEGSNSIGNYQLLCGPCNKRKGDLTDGEFRRRYKLIPSRRAKGPPSKVILQSYFDKMDKQRAKRRRAEDDEW